MILDAYPALRDLAPQAKTQLAQELLAEANDSGEVDLDPRIVAAVEERLAWFDAHPDATFTTERPGNDGASPPGNSSPPRLATQP